jgi:hypothetical protein
MRFSKELVTKDVRSLPGKGPGIRPEYSELRPAPYASLAGILLGLACEMCP